MDREMIEWKDEYCIGVEKIDAAHRQLFSIVSRVIKNCTEPDYDRNRTTCIEAIKYMKSYTLKHFAEEEAYQISIGYPGYRMHKKLHDNMRDVVIPAIEKDVEFNRYSRESMEHFVGVLGGWLAAHVLVEDQAITGKAEPKWQQSPDNNGADILGEVMQTVIAGLFQTNASLISKNYDGHRLGKLFCYRDDFTDPNGKISTVVIAVEESVIENAARKVLNKQVLEHNEIMLPMVLEVMKSFNTRVAETFISASVENTKSSVVQSKEFYSAFEKVYPDYSLLWRCGSGYLAFCIIEHMAEQTPDA
ncbi:MAG: hemerythrin family protein [Ruminococcus sp.]|nr:hemerythrin family protein [Ruminococcus sp.]